MFKIDSNQNIRISRGDDSGKFYIFVNAGTSLEPIRYKFYPAYKVDNSDNLEVSLNKDTFSQKVQNDGNYKFEYNYKYDEQGQRIGELGWYLDSNLVNLNDYGISYTGTPSIFNYILIQYHGNNLTELAFYVFNINDDSRHFIFKKIFRADGLVVTQYDRCRYTRDEFIENIVDDKNDLYLFINAEDTEDMYEGEYQYQVKLKMFDNELNKYVVNTITPTNSFFITGSDRW